jgi:mono/diheme cytochrome c family protein/plastocyanin
VKEKLARIFVITLLVGGSVAIGFAWWQGQTDRITLHARMPETGGWVPDDLTVAASQPLHLRLTSDDVQHGFAIGQSDQPAVDVNPGVITDLTLTFDQPGTYTFYCTRWCGVNHWRMRGTITVTGEGVEQVVTPPLYVQLGLDIDAAHEAQFLPESKPSAPSGANLKVDLSDYLDSGYYRSHSPEELWQGLRSDPTLTVYSDQQLWDVVAFIWQTNTTEDALAEARQLYAQNCAACHGESGAGDGVFAEALSSSSTMSGHDQFSGSETVAPTDFTDPHHMLSTSPAALQGKLIRGGMGTGMPMWGVIFTEEQTWSLVNFLYNFQFEEVQ